MAVLLTVAESLDGPAVSDALAGGGTGVDIGSVVNGSYAPVTDKSANTGQQDIYISHDGASKIENFSAHMQQYGVGTGFTYGGADTAADDFTSMKTMANGSGSSKNNADGLSAGFWVEMDADVSTANAFDQATRPTLVKIFGDGNTDGIDLASAFLIAGDAMVYNSAGEQQASAPVAGEIGPAGNTVLGDSCHLQFRQYLASAFGFGGIFQFELVFSYSFTT